MTRASQIFDDSSRQRLNAAVAAAEARSAVEIIPVVASVSGRYDRAEDLGGLCLAILSLCAAWIGFQEVDGGEDSWVGPQLSLNLVEIVLILVGGFLVGALITSYAPWLRRLFTPRGEMIAEVNEKARQMFYDQRAHHTRGSSGMLLYVSLFERMAAVIADEAIIDNLGMPAIEALCDQLTTKLRAGDITSALEQTIASAGEKLAQVMPRQSGDVNELADALVTVD